MKSVNKLIPLFIIDTLLLHAFISNFWKWFLLISYLLSWIYIPLYSLLAVRLNLIFYLVLYNYFIYFLHMLVIVLTHYSISYSIEGILLKLIKKINILYLFIFYLYTYHIYPYRGSLFFLISVVNLIIIYALGVSSLYFPLLEIFNLLIIILVKIFLMVVFLNFMHIVLVRSCRLSLVANAISVIIFLI